MNIHEYQAKALLHEFGVPISKGVPVLRGRLQEQSNQSGSICSVQSGGRLIQWLNRLPIKKAPVEQGLSDHAVLHAD